MSYEKKRLMWQVPLLIVLVIGTVLIIRQQRAMPYYTNEGFIFGTTYKITYQWDKDLHELIEKRMLEVDNALSTFNKSSAISKINQGDGSAWNDMFLDVFRQAQAVSADTEGAFDVTVAPLVNAWGFGFKTSAMPTRQQVDSIRRFVGYEKVSFDGKKVVRQDRRLMLDCAAIAKGYGVDVVAQALWDEGVRNFMVEIGGEVVTRGINPRRVPWSIGVTKPTDDSLNVGHELQTVINVTDKAMATSGNYRNFYYKGGKKYAHTIDPKTGYPVQHNLLSATVLASQCATADAYATAFMVMGMDGAKAVLKRRPELMAYLIYSNEKGEMAVWFSESLRDKIQE